MADGRGESLVAKHAARQREAFEEAACDDLASLASGVDPELHRMALVACNWDVAAAHATLQEFAASVGGEAGEPGRKRSREHSGKKKEKERDGKKKHRQKSDATKATAAAFGKYGVVKLEDQWAKQPEFFAWLAECKKRDPETLAKWEERELFKEFAEDHNTGTFSHVKFYDLQRWHATQTAAAEADGGGREAGVTFTTLEEDRKRELVAERERAKDASKRDLIEHMRLTGKLDGLREQKALMAQLQLAAQTGDMAQVEKLQKLLAPDDPHLAQRMAAANYGFRPS